MDYSKNRENAKEILPLVGPVSSVECLPEDTRQLQKGCRGAVAALMLAAFFAPTGGLNAGGGDNTEELGKNADNDLSGCEVKPPGVGGIDTSQKWIMVSGECQDGLAAGYGRAILYDKDGDVLLSYRGEFSDGSFHGNGRLQLGELYSGQFDYAGEWEQGIPEGFGSFVKQDGATATINSHMGEFEHGTLTGYGFARVSQPDGTFLQAYSGEFESGSPKGMGVLVEPDGRISYGQVDTQGLNGWGAYRLDSSSIYFGAYEDNELHGECGLAFPEGVFLGHCKDGVADGNGAFVTPVGLVFQGEFANNQANGDGVLLFPDGDTLKGPFKDGTISRDCITEPGGWVLLTGDCSEGLANGDGMAVNTDEGSYYEAEFDHGLIVRKSPIKDPLGLAETSYGSIGNIPFDSDAARRLLEPKPGIPLTATTSPGPFTLDNFGKTGRADTSSQSLPKSDLGGVGSQPMVAPLGEMWPQGKTDEEELGYYGEMKFDLPHGYGRLVTPDYTFLGQFSYGNPSGYGAWSSPEGWGFGTYHLGKREGLGVSAHHSGDGYFGEWADGQRNGMGMILTRTSAELGSWGDSARTQTGTRIKIEFDPSVPEFISILGLDTEGAGLKRMDIVDNNVVFNFLGKDGEVKYGVQLYAAEGFQVKIETREDGLPHGQGQIVIPGIAVLNGQWVDDKLDASNSRLDIIDSRPEALWEVYQCAKSLTTGNVDAAVFLYEILVEKFPDTVAAKRAKTELRKIKRLHKPRK